MKTFKKVLTMLLALTIILNTNMTAFANGTATDHNVNSVNTSAENDGNVVVTDTGVYINGTFYTKAEFIKLLDTAQEVQNPQSRSAIALVAGTWWIPGVGEVVITAAGARISDLIPCTLFRTGSLSSCTMGPVMRASPRKTHRSNWTIPL